MSDLFHEEISEDYIRRVFDTMLEADWHRYQILTKRSERLSQLGPSLPWADHIWMGVSVEQPRVLHRIDDLRHSGAHVTFISFEPLIEHISAPDLSGIDWAIVGGESGKPRREMPHSWARSIRDAALKQDVAFFFKQSSGYRTELDVALEHEDGTFWIWQQFPDHRRAPIQVPRQINGSELGLYIIDDVEEQRQKEKVVHQVHQSSLFSRTA